MKDVMLVALCFVCACQVFYIWHLTRQLDHKNDVIEQVTRDLREALDRHNEREQPRWP